MKFNLPIFLFFFITSSFILSCNIDLGAYSTMRHQSMIPYTSEGKHHGSSLKAPDILDPVHYYIDKNLIENLDHYSSSQKTILNNIGRVGRVVAKGGDIFEIKDGFAYRNEIQVDAGLNLKFSYDFITPPSLEDLQYLKTLKKENILFNEDKTNITIANLSEKEKSNLSQNSQMKKRYPLYIDIFNKLTSDQRNNWNGLNYGPISIPENHFFVLEDNRGIPFGNSLQYGCIPADWIRATFTD